MTFKLIAFQVLAILVSTYVTMTPAHAQSVSDGVALEVISFEKNDVQAAQIARKMYGNEFSHVRAVRVWLEAPSDDPEQLFIELGNGRDCETDCIEVALFYNGQWLEIYRQPKAKHLGLSDIKPTGMKSIIADDRIWSWNETNYVAEPSKSNLKRRDATEKELAIVAEQYAGSFDPGGLESFGPPEIDVYDVQASGYLSKLVAVRSPAICGQSSCPIYLLNSDDQIFRVLQSIEGEVGLSRLVRDEQGHLGVEILTRNGISIVSATTGELLSSLPVQSIHIAGTRK